MLALALLVRDRGGPQKIDEALADLYQLRPRAQLNDVVGFFEHYFGDDYLGVESAVETYREGIIFCAFSGREVTGTKELPSDLQEDVRDYNTRIAPRFNMRLMKYNGP